MRGLFALVGFCLVLPAGAQAPIVALDQGNTRPNPKVKISTEVVNVYAVVGVEVYTVVEDRKGRAVENLTKEDFVITEDNARQQIDYFSHDTDAPLTLGIVVDTSPSQESVLAIEQKEAKMLVEEALHPLDRSFVIQVDERVQLLQELTASKDLLVQAIDRTRVNEAWRSVVPEDPSTAVAGASLGGTHLFDAISFASKLMMNRAGRKVLVLLTDGEDLGSSVTRQAALDAVEKADTTVYSVVVHDKAFYVHRGIDFHGDSVLKKLSKATGGRMSRAEDAVSTAAVFKKLAGELRGQYLLRYTPTQRGDGSFRKIKVEAPHRNWTVRTRGGYYSQIE